MESYKKWSSFPHDLCLLVYLFVCLPVRPSVRLHEFYWCAISGLRRRVSEICALLCFYAALNCSFVRTFKEILSVPSSRVKQSLNVVKKLPCCAACGRISILLRSEQQKTLSMKTFIHFGAECSNKTCTQNSNIFYAQCICFINFQVLNTMGQSLWGHQSCYGGVHNG